MNVLCRVSIPLNLNTLISPVFSSRPIIEKFKTIYIPSSMRVADSMTVAEIITSHSYSIPVHLLETGCSISLDITSENLASEFMELMHEQKSRGKTKIIITKLYNFDPDTNRAVSWGNFKLYDVNDNIHKIYEANILNDLMFSPSIMARDGIWSPLRWFTLESSGTHRYRALYTYNVFIVYLDPESIIHRRKIRIWLGNPIDVFTVRGGFIELTDTGTVRIKRIYLCFFEDPVNVFSENVKGYYICFSESFNDYRTNYPDFPYRNRIFNLNLVDALTPLLYTPYDIVPFLSPYFTEISADEFLIRFTVPVGVIRTVIRRFEKFGGAQNKDMIENYEKIFERINGLVRITESNSSLLVILVNPSIISYLIQMALSGNKLARKYAGKMLNTSGSEILDRLLQIGDDIARDFELKVSLAGCDSLLKTRAANIKKYLEIFRNLSR